MTKSRNASRPLSRIESLEDRRLMSAGGLDPSFGTHGVTSSHFQPFFTPVAMAIQKTGKIVVAGNSADAGGKVSFAVARYNVNGTLDQSFGVHGIAVTPFDVGEPVGNSVSSIAIQSNGKIVVAGTLDQGAFNVSGLVRYNTNGTLDQTFGTHGKATDDVFFQNGHTTGVAIRSTGEIDIVGGMDGGRGIGLARLTSHGQPKHFGSADHVEEDLGALNDLSGAATVLEVGGDTVIGGFYQDESGAQPVTYLGLVRFNSAGDLDTGFGSANTLQLLQVTNNDTLFNLATTADGKFIAAGGSVVARFNSDGSLDQDFGDIGTALTSFGCTSVAVQKDGRILAMGNGKIERFTSNGGVDPTFGQAGTVNTHLNLDAFALQTNQRIVGAGVAHSKTTAARYLTQSADTAGNTLALARRLGAINGRQFFVESLTPTDQNDYYRFTTNGLPTSHIGLFDMVSDADLQLLDKHGNVIAGSSESGTVADIVNFPTAAGTYYIRVYGYHGSNTAYTISVYPDIA